MLVRSPGHLIRHCYRLAPPPSQSLAHHEDHGRAKLIWSSADHPLAFVGTRQVAAPLILTGFTGQIHSSSHVLGAFTGAIDMAGSGWGPCFAAFGAFLGLLSGAFLGLIAGRGSGDPDGSRVLTALEMFDWWIDGAMMIFNDIYIVIHGLMAHTKRLKCTILAGSFPRLCAVRRKTRTQRWHSHRRTCLKLKLAAGVPS